MSQIIIREANLDDAEAIRTIYNYEVEYQSSTMDLVPRSLETQHEWITARSGAFSAFVAQDLTGSVVGFGALSEYKDRMGYRTTVENSIYVHRGYARRGIGRQLLQHLLKNATASGFHTVIARIEATGTASRALHESCGFELIGIEKQVARKFGRWIDMAVMQVVLTNTNSLDRASELVGREGFEPS